MIDQLIPSSQGALVLGVLGLSLYLLTRHFKTSEYGRTREGYVVANRNVGWIRGGMSLSAGWIAAPALLIAAQMGYEFGWPGVFWFTVPNVLSLALLAPLAAVTRRRFPDGFTLTGLASSRYSGRVKVLYVISSGGPGVLILAQQLIGGGLIVSTLTGIPFSFVTIVLAIMALAYCLRIGLQGSIVTDWVQMILIAVIGTGLAVATASVAGWNLIIKGLSGIDGLHDSLISGPGAGVFWGFGLSMSVTLVAAPFASQPLWQRVWATERKHVSKTFLIAAAAFLIVPFSMSMLGFLAAGAGLSIEDTQLTNLVTVLHFLPLWVVFPFLIYLFGGLISTMTSEMVGIGAIAGTDVNKDPSDARTLRWARAGMVGSILVGLGFAILPTATLMKLTLIEGTLWGSLIFPTLWMVIGRGRLPERGAFFGILVAISIGSPLSIVGNLIGVEALVPVASIIAVVVPGVAMVTDYLLGRQGRAGHDEDTRLGARVYS